MAEPLLEIGVSPEELNMMRAYLEKNVESI